VVKQVGRMMEQLEEHGNEFQVVAEQRVLDVRQGAAVAAPAATRHNTTRLSHPSARTADNVYSHNMTLIARML